MGPDVSDACPHAQNKHHQHIRREMELKLVFVLCLLGSLCNANSSKICHDLLQVKLEGQVEEHLRDGSITHDNVTYLKGTHWKNGNQRFGCPCMMKQCLRICPREKIHKLNLTEPDRDFKIDVLHHTTKKNVALLDHFHVMKDGKCDQAFMLEPDTEPTDVFKILSNGSLHLPNLEEDSLAVFGAETYCIMANDTDVIVLSCVTDEEMEKENEGPGFQFYLYPIFMIISIVFLMLTLIAFFAAPDMKNNLHGKSIACQSGTLMIAFICFTVTYLAGKDSNVSVCKFFAYNAYGYMLGSFYWLNTMCFDIFWTFSDFKKMTGSLNQTHKKKFKIYAVYATVNPLILFTTVIILDHVLTDKSWMWPGIGANKCWFRSHSTEFMYFQGPVLILLVFNIVFFSITLIKILIMKRESLFLRRGNSRTHCKADGNDGMEDKQRLVLYIKLFLLMGLTWVMEFISWGAGGSVWIWIIFDLINCSRGVLIFFFCVWSNKKVRYSFLGLFSSKYKSHAAEKSIRSTASKASAVSDMSESNYEPSAMPLKRTDQDETVM